MEILLADPQPNICAAWRVAFADVPSVRVVNSAFEPLIGLFDCLVSPANSFGLMDGGIDAAIIRFFGTQLQNRVQEEIWRSYRGEQPVGTCLMVPTTDPRCPWLAHCPTMRTPMDVSWTNHAYAAFLAALITAETAGIQTLACSGLATRTGRMPAEVAANQMRYAFDLWTAAYSRPDWGTPQERGLLSCGRSREEFLQHWRNLQTR